jgi:perosamine synthetase
MSEFSFIPVAKPWIGEAEADAARRPILGGWVTQGPEVAAFEQEFAAYVGASHACAVSNCTAALHLALRAVGVSPGSEVVTVSHSFVASANAIRYCGAVPVFVDVDGRTYNIDPDRIKAAISGRTRAILCVHQMGMPCDLRAVLQAAQEFSLPVVEDAACAIGSEIFWRDRWERIGKPHGVIACFSFHPRKLMTTGDGGMLTTSDDALDARFRSWRQHSMSISDTARHRAAQVTFEEYPELGFNYRMTDIQAAVGREQLKRIPAIIERRIELADRYTRLLSDIPGVVPPRRPDWAKSNWQSYCVRIPSEMSQLETMQYMLQRGIATRRGIMCAHRERAYSQPGSWRCGAINCDTIDGSCGHLSRSEEAQATAIILPLYHEMTYCDQDRVVACLKAAAPANICTPPGTEGRRVPIHNA